jgi:hypothetical protein
LTLAWLKLQITDIPESIGSLAYVFNAPD